MEEFSQSAQHNKRTLNELKYLLPPSVGLCTASTTLSLAIRTCTHDKLTGEPVREKQPWDSFAARCSEQPIRCCGCCNRKALLRPDSAHSTSVRTHGRSATETEHVCTSRWDARCSNNTVQLCTHRGHVVTLITHGQSIGWMTTQPFLISIKAHFWGCDK